MANFRDCPKFAVYDHYFTPRYAWEQISHLIPQDVVILEGFCLNSLLSESANHLEELTGNLVLSDTSWNFFNVIDVIKKTVLGCKKKLIVVSNPAYDRKILEPALKKLVEVDIPFILLLNSNTVYTNYFNEIFKEKRKYLQIVTPNGKINFEKYDPETNTKVATKKNPFYCVYVCYKMNIPTEKLYLDKRIKSKKNILDREEENENVIAAQTEVKNCLNNYRAAFKNIINENLEKEKV